MPQFKKTKNGYQVRIFLGRDARGTKKFLTKAINGSKRDAQAFVNKAMRERDLGTLTLPSRESVAEYIDRWLATKVKLRPRTREDYEGLTERYIKPELGLHRLSTLSTAQVQSFTNALSAKGLSPRTVKYIFDVLKMALRFAVRSGTLARNPCDLVEIPKQQRREVTPLTVEDARALLAAMDGDRFEALWVLLLHTGMRPSEALGLQWTDIQLEAGVLRIQCSLGRSKSGWSFQEPKTNSSRRSVALSPKLVVLLRRHKATQAEERLRAGPKYSSYNLVFASARGEPLDYRVIVRRHFKHIAVAAGLTGMRPYDLRHSSASLDLILGTPIKIVSERLGHSNVKMTLDTYQHVLPHMQVNAAERMERLLYSTTAPAEEAR